MRESGKKAPPPVVRTSRAKAAPAAANDQGEMPLAELASAVLSRQVRPRAADIRRLAEAVLASAAPASGKLAKASSKKKKKDKEALAPKAESGKKGKKQAKIPGQKTKK